MRGFKRIQFVGELTSTASSTATIFAAGGSGTKWCLTKGIISAVGPGVGATITFAEIYSGGTAGAGWSFKVPMGSAAANVQAMDFGEEGILASTPNTRLVWSIAGANATADIVFLGYYK